MTRESGLWNWLKKARIHYKDQLHMNRVENSVMSGMPDVEGHLLKLAEGGGFWIELKSAARPAREWTPVRFKVRDREAQVLWLTRRRRVGGLSWLLLQVGSAGTRRLYLVSGAEAAGVYDGLTETQLDRLSVLPNAAKTTPEEVVLLASGHYLE